MLRRLSIGVLAMGAIGALYCGWALHRIDANTLSTEADWPRSWPYPDRWLVAMHDWYDARNPAPPGMLKLHGELPRVRLSVGVLLALFCNTVVLGAAMRLASADFVRKYPRRVVGLAVCFGPVALVLSSLSIGWGYPREGWLGVSLAAVGLLVAVLNFYLSFIRPLIYAWRHGSMAAMPHISGLPLIGSLLIVLSGLAGFADWRAALLGSVALVVDTGGLPWFLLATWQDPCLWDGQPPD